MGTSLRNEESDEGLQGRANKAQGDQREPWVGGPDNPEPCKGELKKEAAVFRSPLQGSDAPRSIPPGLPLVALGYVRTRPCGALVLAFARLG